MSKFRKEAIKNAKNIDDAKALALAELGVSEEDVDFEILEEGSKGFLGLGSKDAKVKATMKDIPSFAAKQFLNDVFGAMKLDVDVNMSKTDDGLDIDLKGDNMGIVIGKRGDTLDAIQYLTSLIVNHESDDYIKVSKRIAEKVIRHGKKFTLEPMNPYERRVIHANLQDNASVTTYSVGDEPYRKVVIAPKNAKPYYKKSYNRGGYNKGDRKKPYKNIDEMAASESDE